MHEAIIWFGILFCVSQSAMFSGLNLAYFSINRLRLEIAADDMGSEMAAKVLALRQDSNFLLTTILWGNVGVNVLLTLLTDSVMTGVAAFAFSTGVITFFGEILPQAYFSRNALKMASSLSPVLRFYQVLFYPLAKPCAMILDKWLGKESVVYLTEENIRYFISKHVSDISSEIDEIEGKGAINFLELDDHKILEEGEDLQPLSIINMPTEKGHIVFPAVGTEDDELLVQKIMATAEKWVIMTNEKDMPGLVLDADGYLRSNVLNNERKPIQTFCHLPIVITDPETDLGTIIKLLKKNVDTHSDSPIDRDVVLFWTKEHRRIITGADLFGRLLKGI